MGFTLDSEAALGVHDIPLAFHARRGKTALSPRATYGTAADTVAQYATLGKIGAAADASERFGQQVVIGRRV